MGVFRAQLVRSLSEFQNLEIQPVKKKNEMQIFISN